MEALANLNGEILPLAEAKIPVLDRGFLFGDAVYEVLRVYAGKPWLQAEHFARLAQSLEAIRIGSIDLEGLQTRMLQTIAAGSFQEATVYIQITRGVAPRRHPFPTGVTPTELLSVQQFKDPYVEARRAGVAVITQADMRWKRCDIKSTNLLANVLAIQAAVEAGCVEALLVQADGTVTEGTHTSLLGVKDGVLLTAPQSPAILPGITRSLILRLAKRAQLSVREQSLKHADLSRVTELFLTGTTSEVLPIVSVDGRPIGEGRRGSIARRLQEAYAEAVKEFAGSTSI